MVGLSPLEIGIALAIVFFAAVLQGAVGMGFALISAPLLALVEPTLAPQAVLGTGSVLSLLVALRERHAVVRGELSWALSGYLAGALVAGGLLALLPPAALSLLFAGFILLAVVLSFLRLRIRITPASLLPAGILAGLMGTITSTSGPPLALLYQNRQGDSIRATLGLFFVAGGLLSIAILALSGRFGLAAVAHNLMLLPAVIVGFTLSGRFIPLLDRGPIRPAILLICTASAVAVIARTVL